MLVFNLLTPQSTPKPIEVSKVTCETTAGMVTLLPRHLDCTAELTPSVMSYVSNGTEKYIAVDGGVLLKVGENVSVSTNFAVFEDNLQKLKDTVKNEFKQRNEDFKKTNTSMMAFEATLARLILELKKK